jgi:hypothetical protein
MCCIKRGRGIICAVTAVARRRLSANCFGVLKGRCADGLWCCVLCVRVGWGQAQGYSVDIRRAEAFNTLVFGEIGYSITTRFIKASTFHPRVFKGNPWCVLAPVWGLSAACGCACLCAAAASQHIFCVAVFGACCKGVMLIGSCAVLCCVQVLGVHRRDSCSAGHADLHPWPQLVSAALCLELASLTAPKCLGPDFCIVLLML